MARDFGRGGGRDDRGPRQMHDAVCSECGAACQVPFKPTEGKPVYCRECFSKRRPGRF
jgi:CxxC-x17-CxxC domain-containing protein